MELITTCLAPLSEEDSLRINAGVSEVSRSILFGLGYALSELTSAYANSSWFDHDRPSRPQR